MWTRVTRELKFCSFHASALDKTRSTPRDPKCLKRRWRKAFFGSCYLENGFWTYHHHQLALQPGVGLGLRYNMPPDLSVPCSVSLFVYTHLSQVHGHVIQPSHSWSSSSSCCIQLSVKFFLLISPWPCHLISCRATRSIPSCKTSSAISIIFPGCNMVWTFRVPNVKSVILVCPGSLCQYVPRLVVGFRNNYFLQGEVVSLTPMGAASAL